MYGIGKDLLEGSKSHYKAYCEFAKVLKKNHGGAQHKQLEEDILNIIVRSMGRVLNPGMFHVLN